MYRCLNMPAVFYGQFSMVVLIGYNLQPTVLNLETAPYLQDSNPECICLNRGLQKVL